MNADPEIPTAPATAPDEPHAAPQRWRDDRHRMIEIAAYYLAERRNFAPGHETEDWLEAESLVDARLMGEGREF